MGSSLHLNGADLTGAELAKVRVTTYIMGEDGRGICLAYLHIDLCRNIYIVEDHIFQILVLLINIHACAYEVMGFCGVSQQQLIFSIEMLHRMVSYAKGK